MGDFSGSEKINITCVKMAHMGKWTDISLYKVRIFLNSSDNGEGGCLKSAHNIANVPYTYLTENLKLWTRSP